jgi:glycosyltransferase involved in cell wall biosynthesis
MRHEPFLRRAYRRARRFWHPPLPLTLPPSPPSEGLKNTWIVGRAPRRALVSYLTGPLLDSPANHVDQAFSNPGIALTMVQVLTDLGYTVDVVNFDDRQFRPRSKYDLFIGHGGINYQNIAKRVSKNCIKIYFSTGTYWKTHNFAEDERLDALYRRRGVRLPRDRYIYDSEEWANYHADAIICLGNDRARQSYAKFGSVYSLNNAAYATRTAGNFSNHTASQHNFLFFSGPGNVHKGLDLLLEAFTNSPNQLFICQTISPEFGAVYAAEMERPNIHILGFVRARTAPFYELVNKCAYVILPSCSEGSPGSVTECMHHGLIPVLTPQCNIDVQDFGLEIREGTVDSVKASVEAASARPGPWKREASRRTQEVAQNDFSEAAFYVRLMESIEAITGAT